MGWVKAAAIGVTALAAIQGGKNKRAANDQAREVELEARIRAQNMRKLARQIEGEAAGATAASGVVIDEGSPLLVQGDIARQSELDAFYTILTGQNQARNIRRSGSAEQAGSLLGAAGTALSIYGSGG